MRPLRPSSAVPAWRWQTHWSSPSWFAVLLCMTLGCGTPPDTPDYRAADWVLSVGGQVRISTDSGAVVVQTRNYLPREAFRLTKISWDIYPGDRNVLMTDAELARFAELQHLQELDLWAADIGDAGLKHLAALPELMRLQLSQTRVTDAGLEHLKGLKNLRHLALYYTKVTPAGVRRLQRELPKCEIHLQPTKGKGAGRQRG